MGFKGVEPSLESRHGVSMWIEGEVRRIAATQHGIVDRAQLAALGVSDGEIRSRLRSGRLEHLHPGVYYLDSIPATWKTSVLAGVLAAGPDALASHRTAALLWEFDAIYGRLIEVTVPYSEGPDPEGVILHRTRRINPGMVVDGIPVVSPEKGLLDITPFVPNRVLEKAMVSTIRNELTNLEKLDLAVGLHGGRGVAGTRRFRQVIRIVAEDASGSVAEIDLKHIVLDAPVPRPIQQLRIRLPDGSHAYPDLAWPDRKRLIEADGFETHSTPEQLQHDLNRQNQLMELGWDLRRFTAKQIRERPDEVREEVIRFINKPFRED